MPKINKLVWILYIILILLMTMDEITTKIGLSKDLDDKNQLIKKNYYLNLSLKIMAILILGLIIYYTVVQINNINLIINSKV